MAARGIAPRLAEVRPPGRHASMRFSPRRRSSGPRDRALYLVRQARRAQRASRLPARRNAVPAARPSGSPLVSAAAGRRERGRPMTRLAGACRAAGLRSDDPELPALTHRRSRHRAIRAGATQTACSASDSRRPTPAARATEHIESLVREALDSARLGRRSRSRRVLSPAWSSDWISAEGRRKLAEYGIVPPATAASLARRATRAAVACPRCRSTHTECISEFGSTPCKALHRCRDCLEPFECFKCI